MPDVNALYPAPPKQQEGLLQGDPLKMIGAVNALNQSRLFEQTFQARKAIGQAYQQAIRPDGSIDTPTLMRAIQANPDAAFSAGEASAGALTRQGQQIDNAAKAFDLNSRQNHFIVSGLGALASKPNVTYDDVLSYGVTASRNANIPTEKLVAWLKSAPRDPKKLKEWLSTQATMAMGASESTTPGVIIGYDPKTGAAIYGTKGQSVYSATGGGQGASAGAGDQPGIVAPRPGFAEAATTSARAGAEASVHLREASDTSPGRKAILGNLEALVGDFKPGPGAHWEQVAKSFVNRNVPLPKDWQFDPKSIASQEEFNKQSVQLAQQQFAAIGGTGTDAKFSSAFETSPNDALSQMGNKGIIRLLKGNEDALAAKYKAWQSYKKAHGPDSYDDFSEEFNSSFDPRVFQFKYMDKDERQKYINRMDDDEYSKFVQDLHAAKKRGWTNMTVEK